MLIGLMGIALTVMVLEEFEMLVDQVKASDRGIGGT